MYKSTNQFFSKVFEDKVTKIEQHNYVDLITNNHDLKKLKTLSFDLTVFISNKIEDLESEIEDDQIEKAIQLYKESNVEIPFKKTLNIDYLYAKTNNLPLENIPEKLNTIDLEEMFYKYKLFPIRSLKFQIDSLIKEQLENRKKQIEPEPLDLSDTSAVEKIIYLEELGIIDFLRTKPEFMGSTNLMATILSAITDETATTLQTSLNRLINKDTADKNHPYKAPKTVDKVRQTLINKNIKPKTS